MWQRFTERARRVVLFAQGEALMLRNSTISSEHLLLALLREDDNVAARVLYRMDISREQLRAEVKQRMPPGNGIATTEHNLTQRGQRVIDLAYDEARALRAFRISD